MLITVLYINNNTKEFNDFKDIFDDNQSNII